ncbi:replication protein A 70 kDa DNA-binding subunit B, partial [Capsella rubella]
MVLSDELGKKIHATVKKDLVPKYVNRLHVDEWMFIENFSLSYATGQFRPTSHLYKMAFITGTVVMPCDPKSESYFLSLAKYQKIQSGELNPHMLVDVVGQIVTIGELENLEANNKPTTKIDFELRDDTDERLACTLWGTLAEQVHSACEESDGSNVVVVLRFVKIKAYKVFVNPTFPEVDLFRNSLPPDGLVLVFRERRPRLELVRVNNDAHQELPRRTIEEIKNSLEVGRVRLLCTIYGIDTDWAWYYISCRSCNKKVNHIHSGVHGVNNKGVKPRFWCDTCKSVVTNVVARFMLYANVMDTTGEAKLLLFDSICTEIIGQSAHAVLDGSVDEIEDPENLPEPLTNLIGKTFLFLLCVEKENIWDGKEIYKVSKALLKHGLLEEELLEYSTEMSNAASIESGEKGILMLENIQDTPDSITPSSKRVYGSKDGPADQTSTSKKLCVQPIDLDKVNPE